MIPSKIYYVFSCFDLQIARIPEFKLAEGVDRTGVTTKILTCNCSMNLIIENKSRFFRLHIHPPMMDMKFSILPFAFSHVSIRRLWAAGSYVYIYIYELYIEHIQVNFPPSIFGIVNLRLRHNHLL